MTKQGPRRMAADCEWTGRLTQAREFHESARSLVTLAQSKSYNGDPALLAAALGGVARVSSMSQVERDAGITREGLYKALSADGNPSFATVLKVIRALGLQIDVKPMARA